MQALITKRNSPKVNMVMGNVRITKIGFTKALKTSIIIATNNADPKLVTVTPGSK